MNLVWRFYVDQQGEWRWQQLTLDRTVTSESASSHITYDECLAAAAACGYSYEPSQTGYSVPRRRNFD